MAAQAPAQQAFTVSIIAAEKQTYAVATQLQISQVWFQFQRVANGVASAVLEQALPANALVRDFNVKVQASRASWTALGALGQVRVQDSSTSGSDRRTTVVVDFGTPRTVAAAAVLGTATFKLLSICKWKGDGFTLSPAVWRTDATGSAPQQVSFPEISTERLQLEMEGTLTQAAAETQLAVELPSLPADLEIRINGGAPAWTSDGPVRPGQDGWTLVPNDANQTAEKTVSLAEAVRALVGNPDSTASVPLHLELRARIPGRLAITAGTVAYDHLQRTLLPPDAKRDLIFEGEGAQDVPLTGLDGQKVLQEVRATVVANLPKERAIPAVGPPPVSAVELVLDAGRSACVRFPGGLSELTALRLPLRAQDGGAEVRVQLLAPLKTGTGFYDDEPGAPLPGASASRPETLDAVDADDDADPWTLFTFDKPVALKAAVWVSLQVTRGTVKWTLGQYYDDEVPYAVRRGAPTGPWVPLPAAVTTLAGVGGRLHAIGHAPKDQPLAPIQVQAVYPGGIPAASEPMDVTPSAKGVAVTWLPQDDPWFDVQGGKAVVLRVTSRCAGTVTVRDVVTVVSK